MQGKERECAEKDFRALNPEPKRLPWERRRLAGDFLRFGFDVPARRQRSQVHGERRVAGDEAGIRRFRSLATCHLSRGLYSRGVSRKSARIGRLVQSLEDAPIDPHYTGYFDLFNQQKFFEAHDVLEHIWLKDKPGPNGAFYKGLIQLAGAFVHLQKDRLRPASALFKLALANLDKYPCRHDYLNVDTVRSLIQKWLGCLESAQFEKNPLTSSNAPRLALDLPHG